MLQVDEVKDQVILTTFQTGLVPRDFFFSITKSLPKTVADLLRKAQKYMNAEDAMLTKEMKGKRNRDKGTVAIAIKKKKKKGDTKCWADYKEKEGTSKHETQVH